MNFASLYTDPYYQFYCPIYGPGWYGCQYIYDITTSWVAGDYTPLIFNGEWLYYRIDAYGQNLKISYSQDGNTFTPVSWEVTTCDINTCQTVQQNSVTALMPRNAARAYKLMLGVSQPIHLDDVQITTLDSSGNVGTSVMAEAFNGCTVRGYEYEPGDIELRYASYKSNCIYRWCGSA